MNPLELFTYKDGELFWKVGKLVGTSAGCPRPDGRVKIRYKGKYYLRYHLVWWLHHGYKPKLIDHINTDHTDDRIENLREATQQQNRMNQGARISKTGYKDVQKDGAGYSARIKKNGITYNLGYSRNPEECARMYDKRAKELFGEFANLNFKEKAL